jgi:hypothetical protein
MVVLPSTALPTRIPQIHCQDGRCLEVVRKASARRGDTCDQSDAASSLRLRPLTLRMRLRLASGTNQLLVTGAPISRAIMSG